MRAVTIPALMRSPAGTNSAEINRRFYDDLWAETSLIGPERFNTWPLVRELAAAGARRLEIGPGLRPRLPVAGTCCIEISSAALSRLAGQGGLAAQATATNLPFPDAVFDLAMAMDVIEHVEDDEPVFRELARVLRPGGTLVLSSPLHPDRWTRFDDVVGHRRRYRPQELLARLIRHGLTLERSAFFGMQPRSRLLSNLGAWALTRRRAQAMRWYNRVLLPLGLRFARELRLVPGMVDVTRADEVLLVCRRNQYTPGPGKG